MFSRATITDVMYLLRDMNTHSTLDAYAFRYGLDEIAVGANKDERVLSIGKYLLNHPEAPGILSDNLLFEIVEDIISKTVMNDYYFDSESNEFKNYHQLRRLLLKDGFVIENNSLIRVFDTDIDFSGNSSLIEKLLDKYMLSVSKGHYNQANNAFNRGDWAACNAQLRSYVEELLNRIAEKVTGISFASSQDAKIALSQANPPLFYRQLNEWLDNGQGYYETFWKRLHPEGSHPGLSDEEDSIFRLNLVQISTLEILKRYDRNYG